MAWAREIGRNCSLHHALASLPGEKRNWLPSPWCPVTKATQIQRDRHSLEGLSISPGVPFCFFGLTQLPPWAFNWAWKGTCQMSLNSPVQSTRLRTCECHVRGRPAEGAGSLKESVVKVGSVSRIWRWRSRVPCRDPLDRGRFGDL